MDDNYKPNRPPRRDSGNFSSRSFGNGGDRPAPAPVYSVQNRLKDLLGDGFDRLESGSLRLNKMLRFYSDQEKKKTKGDPELESICKCINNYGRKVQPSQICNVPGLKQFRMKLAGRMMINQSGSVLNLGILLHRNFSCPFIPGSALKGVTRHYVKQNFGDNEDFRRIFGQGEVAGSVAFLNAFPSNWSMVVDVLTKHNDPNAEFLNTKNPVPNAEFLDTKNPVPIFFPAVEKGAVFTFSAAPAKAGRRTAEADVELAMKWLKAALKEWGVGAKTSAGYGWFKEA